MHGARPPVSREQIVLFAPTLNETISEDHTVRLGEIPFGILKAVMGVRQFLLRGLEKVKTEWLWACTAFNLAKLVREIARMRREFAHTAG